MSRVSGRLYNIHIMALDIRKIQEQVKMRTYIYHEHIKNKKARKICVAVFRYLSILK